MKIYKVLLLLFILSSCSKNTIESSEKINIRILNSSSFKYKNVKVNTSIGSVDYGNLDSGSWSEYKSFELAYKYAFVELMIDGKIYTLQPIDYVGETPLRNGSYTYAISAELKDRFDTLSLELMYDIDLLDDTP